MQRIHRASFASLMVATLLATLVLGAAPAAADSFTSWTPGPNATGDNTYIGFIDVPSMNATASTGNFTVLGWFADTTAQGWAGADQIQVWQGTMDGGGSLLANATIPVNRPDVAAATGNPYFAAAGFSALIPGGALSTGNQVLSVYAHTPGKGWWYLQTQVNVSSSAPASAAAPSGAPSPVVVAGSAYPFVGIELPKEGDQVGTKNDYTVIGYALDTNAAPNQGVAGSGVDRVQVYVGEREAGGTYLGDADLGYSDSVALEKYGGQFENSGWRLTFKPTQFRAKGYTMYAYARSAVTGREDVAARYFAIKED